MDYYSSGMEEGVQYYESRLKGSFTLAEIY